MTWYDSYGDREILSAKATPTSLHKWVFGLPSECKMKKRLSVESMIPATRVER